MSQEEILNILKEFGGVASTNEIKRKAKEKYPYTSLRRLKRNNRIEKFNGKWRIKEAKGLSIYKSPVMRHQYSSPDYATHSALINLKISSDKASGEEPQR